MNYELAKELKDAGFPQMGDGWALMPHNPAHADSLEDQTMSRLSWERYVLTKPEERNRYGEDLYAPNLEELIEACGEKFGNLILRKDGLWEACSSELDQWAKIAEGSFPSEALARLWLALNRKTTTNE